MLVGVGVEMSRMCWDSAGFHHLGTTEFRPCKTEEGEVQRCRHVYLFLIGNKT